MGKGKDVSHLKKSVLDQLNYLDEEDDDDDWGDLSMFETMGSGDKKFQQQVEKEMKAALRADKKESGAAKLLKAAVNVDYDPTQDFEKDEKLDVAALEAQLEETLDMADYDITDNQVVAHCEETWENIEDNKEEQTALKATQENVVGHLVETNEWLFAALQETLNDNL